MSKGLSAKPDVRVSLQKSVKESKVTFPLPGLHFMKWTEQKSSAHKKENISLWTINSSECPKHFPRSFHVPKNSHFSPLPLTHSYVDATSKETLKLVLHLSLVFKKTQQGTFLRYTAKSGSLREKKNDKTVGDLGRLTVSKRLFPSFHSLCNRGAALEAIYNEFISAGIPRLLKQIS